jgi:small subunit ribosomal protein S1
MEIRIFDLDPKQEKLIISEKAKEKEKIREILKNYKVDEIVEGEITGITDFGVFIKFPLSDSSAEDYQPMEGLIHISELDWQLIDNPADIVKVGDKVKAKIISISDNKVSLSLKALKEDPWQDFEKEYQKGSSVEGEVMKFNPYGAFIQINDKIQGLCHISEFGTKEKMEKELKMGEKYIFEISSIDPADHRMNLKLKK